jgi:flagellar hook-length control protein FliK
MTMMVTIEKVNTFNFDNAVNTSYFPASFSRVETNDTRDFMEEFEKVAAADQRDFEIKKRGEQNLVNPMGNNDSAKENRVNTEADRKPDERMEETGPRENRKDESPKENEKVDNSQNKRESTGNSREHGRTGKNEVTNNQAGKEIIQKNQLQRTAIIKIKEDIKENFTESKKFNSTDQLTSGSEEKGIKNKLVDQINSRFDKTGDVKPGEEQTDKGHNVEKRQVQESDTNKELKLQENDSHQEKQPNFNLLNDLSGNIRQLNGIKVKQVFNQQNVFDQYQIFQEKIAHSVENSIKFLISSGESRAVIQLHPPELGRVQMELVVNDNQVTAKINTENAAVKEVILANLEQLKSNLANAGTQINKFDVEVGGFKNYYEQHFSKGRTGNSGQKGSAGLELFPDGNELMLDQVINQQALTFYLGRRINCLI